MGDSLLQLVEELRKLEQKHKLVGDKLSSHDRERIEQLKKLLAHKLHGEKADANRRQELRVPVTMRARYHTGDDFAHNYIGNLSNGGVFITTPKPLPLDTVVKLYLFFEDKKLEIEVEGKVVWENTQGGRLKDNTKPGMGIKFTKLEPEAKNIINDLVHDLLKEHAQREQEEREAKAKKKGKEESEISSKSFFDRFKKK